MSDRPIHPTQIFRIFIKATPQAIWDAITTREWTARYGYRAPVDYDLRPGGAFRAHTSTQEDADAILEGEVIEADPPRRLVQTWRPLWHDEIATRLTYELEAGPHGITEVTLTHDVTGAPETATEVAGERESAGGGWAMVLSDLKSLLETGEPMAAD